MTRVRTSLRAAAWVGWCLSASIAVTSATCVAIVRFAPLSIELRLALWMVLPVPLFSLVACVAFVHGGTRRFVLLSALAIGFVTLASSIPGRAQISARPDELLEIASRKT